MQYLTAQDFRTNARTRKAKRASHPCDACRTRKTRCVANASGDNCVHCDLKGTDCEYRRGPPDRRSGGGQRGGGPSSTFSRRRTDHGGTTVSVGPDASGATPNQVTSKAPSRAASGSGGSPSNVSVPEHLDEFTHGQMPPLGLAAGRFAELYGLGSDMEPILMRHRPYDSLTHEYRLGTHSIRRVADQDVGYPLTFHMASDSKAFPGQALLEEVDAIEHCIQPNGPRLMNLYLRHVHPAYPILDSKRTFEAYERSYREIPSALLGVMYLISMKWWSFDAELSIMPQPDVRQLRALVNGAVQRAYHTPKLASIQAVLLLLQCQPEDPLNPAHTFAAGLTAQGIAVAECIGLHLDPDCWSIPAHEKNIRKRLTWALFIQDRWTALAYGRPIHMREDEWEMRNPDLVDFDDHLEGALEGQAGNQLLSGSANESKSMEKTGHLLFMHMTHVTKLLSRVLSTFYTRAGAREQDTVKLYEQARPIWQALQDFRDKVPSSLVMQVRYQRQFSFHGQLWFSYYGTCIALLRRLVRSTALPPACVDDTTLSTIRQYALQTAQDAMAFVYELRPDHLEGFWLFNAPYLFSLLGSFCTLLLVTSLSTQERTFWQDSLNSYLWHLRTMSKGSDAMRYAVNRLEGAILRGLGHALAVNLTDTWRSAVSPLIAQPQQELDFADFGHWDLADEDFGMLDIIAFDALADVGTDTAM